MPLILSFIIKCVIACNYKKIHYVYSRVKDVFLPIDIDRDALRIVFSWFGGIQAVAHNAGFDHGNLSKWLRGAPTLSEERVSKLLDAVGLPNGKANTSHVHSWRSRKHLSDIGPALSLFFPNGAEVASAPWSMQGISNISKAFKLKNAPDSLHALSLIHI